MSYNWKQGEIYMTTLVINELRAYARHYRGLGMTVKVIGKTKAHYSEAAWVWAAKAWNENQKCYNYLLVRR